MNIVATMFQDMYFFLAMQFMPILANLLCVMSYNYGLYKDVVFVTAELISIFANIVCAHI